MPPRRKPREQQELQRRDNNLGFTSWPIPPLINQKNYYTDFLKRDDQALSQRLQAEENRNRLAKAARDKDRALAQQNQSPNEGPMAIDGPEAGDDEMPESDLRSGVTEIPGSKTIVIHPGSQNLRVGLASDPLPKTVPMVVARKAEQSESETGAGEPKPKRRKVEGQADQLELEDWFTEAYSAMTVDLKGRLRGKGIRFVPNTREQAQAFNRKVQPDTISEHNDINKIEWTDVVVTDNGSSPDYLVGHSALRIPDQSKPRYKLCWPLRYGTFNERDYSDQNHLYRDIVTIIEEAIKDQLGIRSARERAQYSCVLVVPDLYEKNYIITMLELLFREFGFTKVSLIQESMSASFGAGFSTCCVVDVGAYKTSICCVDEGLVVEHSRITMRYGSADVTEAFVKMLLSSSFPYADLNLKRRFDFLLAEELKQRFGTLAYSDLAHGSQQHDFHLRAPNQETRHYRFKCYDEVMLSTMGYYRPGLFDTADKLVGRRSLIGRSYDLYDGTPNDPISTAQAQLLDIVAATNPPPADSAGVNGSTPVPPAVASTPARPANGATNGTNEEPATSPPREAETPQPHRAISPVEGEKDLASISKHPLTEIIRAADRRDRTLPCIPLDEAIALSIEHAARSDERKMRDFFGGIIPIGGGSQTKGFRPFLEEELQNSVPKFRKEILIGPPPREIDPQVLVWKGASVFGKLTVTNDSWISGLEWDRLGSRVLAYKCLWNW